MEWGYSSVQGNRGLVGGRDRLDLAAAAELHPACGEKSLCPGTAEGYAQVTCL